MGRLSYSGLPIAGKRLPSVLISFRRHEEKKGKATIRSGTDRRNRPAPRCSPTCTGGRPVLQLSTGKKGGTGVRPACGREEVRAVWRRRRASGAAVSGRKGRGRSCSPRSASKGMKLDSSSTPEQTPMAWAFAFSAASGGGEEKKGKRGPAISKICALAPAASRQKCRSWSALP